MWEAQFMECTFKPQINHRRDNFDDEKDGSCDRFEQLFLDAESRRRRQAEYIQWYPEGSVHINTHFEILIQCTM
jgi:hypothetical protein